MDGNAYQLTLRFAPLCKSRLVYMNIKSTYIYRSLFIYIYICCAVLYIYFYLCLHDAGFECLLQLYIFEIAKLEFI